MAKSNKELTVEVVCAYLAAWGNTSVNALPVSSDDLPELLRLTFDAIQSLPNSPS